MLEKSLYKTHLFHLSAVILFFLIHSSRKKKNHSVRTRTCARGGEGGNRGLVLGKLTGRSASPGTVNVRGGQQRALLLVTKIYVSIFAAGIIL